MEEKSETELFDKYNVEMSFYIWLLFPTDNTITLS